MTKRHRDGELYPRRCAACLVPKAWADFYAHSKGSHRRHSQCRDCLNKSVTKWTRDNPRRFAEATNRLNRQAQAATKETATNHGKEWTSAELEIVDDRTRTAREVGLILGRTMYAVKHIRRAIDAEDPKTLYLLGRAGGYAEASR